MQRRLTLAEFTDDELLRAPLLFDAVIDAVIERWRQELSVAGRSGGEMARMLQLSRNELLAAALRTLRLAASGREKTPVTARKPELSLLDEGDVACDLEIGRCAEIVKSEAEAELREVHAYTSALVGDIAVSRDTNPLRPEFFARALWDGCQALPAAPAVRLDAFRRAVAPLARCVRASLAATSQRLATQGVVPATYRTLVFPPASGGRIRERVHFPPEDLTTLRDSVLGTLNVRQPRVADAPPAAVPAEPPLADMMRRLYDQIVAEGGLPPAVLKLLADLRPAFQRIAPHDAGMIDSFDHPVWQFIDRLAFTVASTPPREQQRLLGLARNLVAHLVADPAPDALRFAWAAGKLQTHDRQSLALAVHAASEEIRRLTRAPSVKDAATPVRAEEALALDVASLDTVPGDILDAPGLEAGTLEPTVPGDRLRLFLQREWRSLQLLWSGDDLWLLRDLAGGRHWALRPGVIDRLVAARLVTPLRMRSLVRRAAERVQAALS